MKLKKSTTYWPLRALLINFKAMGLYRQIAGDSVGLFLEAADIETTNGGGGGMVFYDPGIPVPIPITSTFPMVTPSQPLLPEEPTTNGGTTSASPIDTNQPVAEPVQTATADNSTPAPVTPIPGVGKNNWLAAISLGALIVNMLYGEQILKKYRSAAFVGGLGALWYGLSKTQTQIEPTSIT